MNVNTNCHLSATTRREGAGGAGAQGVDPQNDLKQNKVNKQ